MAIRVAPLGAADAGLLATFACREDVLRFGDHTLDAQQATWRSWLGSPDPNLGLTLGAFVDGQLEAALKLAPFATRRRVHGASVHLLASDEPGGDAALDALLRAALDTGDRWLQVLRYELVCRADHPRVEGLFAAHGLALEARLRRSLRDRRGTALLDEAVLGRVAPEAEREPLGSPLEIPPRASRRATVRLRPARPSDAAALASSMSEPIVVWGTLQLPFQRIERWGERLKSRPPARTTFLIAEVSGAVAGAGALTVPAEARRDHTGTIGMHVATAAQGQGVGTRLMAALLEDADRRGLSRVELSVYADNERARRLYERAGFVVEGRSRRGSFRDGGYADDLLMARVRAP